MTLSIKKEFKELIPKLTEDEYAMLKQSIIDNGCQDAIKTWSGFILDGHNRFEICTELLLHYDTEEMNFETEQEAVVWIINNQLGRRNLSDFQKIELAEKKKDILLEKGKKKMSDGGKGLSKNNKPSETHDTRKEIAKGLGMSMGKVAQAQVVMKKAPEEIKEKARKDEISIGKAYQETKAMVTSTQPKRSRANLKEPQKPKAPRKRLPRPGSQGRYTYNNDFLDREMAYNPLELGVQFSLMAVSQLERIDCREPSRAKGLNKVLEWLYSNYKEGLKKFMKEKKENN
jgi:ParB-like chromosome segregation protein Spo0J